MKLRLLHVQIGITLFVAAVFAAPAERASAQSTPAVDVALVLAVDVSGSITPDRWDLERQGYAEAFRNSEVLKAVRSGAVGAIAVTLEEWSGEFEQAQVIPWTVIDDVETAESFAASLATLPRLFTSHTSISSGLRFSAQLLDTKPYPAARRVIDVSGDGPDNTTSPYIEGSPADVAAVQHIRDELVAEGITINGLPIFGDPRIHDLDLYYRDNVIGGPGAFMIVAESFATFATAVKRKLVLEIAQAQPDAPGTNLVVVARQAGRSPPPAAWPTVRRVTASRRATSMAKYLVEATYSAEGLKGVEKDKVSGRRAAEEKAVKSLGGKVEAFYFALGERDVVTIVELPDLVSVTALAMHVSDSGLVRTKTTALRQAAPCAGPQSTRSPSWAFFPSTKDD